MIDPIGDMGAPGPGGLGQAPPALPVSGAAPLAAGPPPSATDIVLSRVARDLLAMFAPASAEPSRPTGPPDDLAAPIARALAKTVLANSASHPSETEAAGLAPVARLLDPPQIRRLAEMLLAGTSPVPNGPSGSSGPLPERADEAMRHFAAALLASIEPIVEIGRPIASRSGPKQAAPRGPANDVPPGAEPKPDGTPHISDASSRAEPPAAADADRIAANPVLRQLLAALLGRGFTAMQIAVLRETVGIQRKLAGFDAIPNPDIAPREPVAGAPAAARANAAAMPPPEIETASVATGPVVATAPQGAAFESWAAGSVPARAHLPPDLPLPAQREALFQRYEWLLQRWYALTGEDPVAAQPIAARALPDCALPCLSACTLRGAENLRCPDEHVRRPGGACMLRGYGLIETAIIPSG